MIFKIGILMIMIVSSIEDIRKKEVPIWEIIACGIISGLSIAFGVYKNSLDMFELSFSLIPGCLMIMASFVSRQQLGYGDGLLVLFSGPALGFYDMGLSMVIAFFVSSIISGGLILFKKAGRKTAIPFVPFIAAGLVVMCVAKI